MAGERLPIRATGENASSILRHPRRGIIRIVKAGIGCAEHEEKKTCRSNFRSTILTFRSITGWLRSGSFPRTPVLS